VPDGVRAIIDERVGRLDDDARKILAALAVLGREASWETLASMTGLDVALSRARVRTAKLAGIVTDETARVGTQLVS
jgi:DNA-binding Lrp family transcriptional regulator